MPYYILDPALCDPKRIRKERQKAQELKRSSWWKNKIREGICHYCQQKVGAKELTMDHIVPIARGGTSAAGNVVPACRECNQTKKLNTPAEEILERLSSHGISGSEEEFE